MLVTLSSLLVDIFNKFVCKYHQKKKLHSCQRVLSCAVLNNVNGMLAHPKQY
jgi:hypothetical protein